MKYPRKLEKGGTVGLICTSSPITAKRLKECVARIEALGYRAVTSEIATENYGGYMAGSGQARANCLNGMFENPDIDAIFCIRGGDGGSRIMEYLDLDLIAKHPKIFVGYSDTTSIHLALNKNCGFVTFHGPMVSSNMVNKFDDETKSSLFQAINADEAYLFQNTVGSEISVLKEGKATGILTGGNLAILSASIGTPYEVDTKDKIFFIEEVGETINRVERFAYHLRNAGKFKDCRGVILGQFTDCVNKNNPDFMERQCFADVLMGLEIPVLANVQSGHGSPMMTLPLGAECSIDTADRSLRFAKPQRD